MKPTPYHRYERKFFLRVGQAGRAAEAHVDRISGYLFPLPVIMDAQGDLAQDARHLARAVDPETSKRAAERAATFKGKHAAAIFGWLCDHDAGGTYREIAAGTGLEPVAVARRMRELQDRAGVYAEGERNGMAVYRVRR